MRSILIAAALALTAVCCCAIPATAAAESLAARTCGSQTTIDATAITAATGTVDVALCDHAQLEVRIQNTGGGATADYTVQSCAYVASTLVCDNLSPAISGTVAGGSRDLALITQALGRIRVNISGNTGTVHVSVTAHP